MHPKLKISLTNLRKPFATFGLTSSLLMTTVLTVACSASKWHEVSAAPNTGNPIAEQQTAPPPVVPPKAGDKGFISSDRLIVKQPGKPDTHLERNDTITVTNPAPEGQDGSAEVVVTNTHVPTAKHVKAIIPKKYIADKPVVPTNDENAASKYFVIQNIATQKLRVYRNCMSLPNAVAGCAHKLVFETDMVAGEESKHRSILGSFQVDTWFKFYEDQSHFFPSFYSADLPPLPKAGASLRDWLSTELLGPNKKAVTRGSFGWYTAKLTPDAHTQWTHGTFGWAADGGKFIEAMAKPEDGLRLDPRSQGCTRVENRAIALMREILPPGTRMLKIYAREALADSTLKRYQVQGSAPWKFKLTTAGTMSKTLKSGLSSAKADDKVLDEGIYTLDQTPTVARGNIYRVKAEEMKGEFFIDEGRLADYTHPASLRVGGEPLNGGPVRELPSLVISSRSASAVKAEDVAHDGPTEIAAVPRVATETRDQSKDGPSVSVPLRTTPRSVPLIKAPTTPYRVPGPAAVAPAKPVVAVKPAAVPAKPVKAIEAPQGVSASTQLPSIPRPAGSVPAAAPAPASRGEGAANDGDDQ